MFLCKHLQTQDGEQDTGAPNELKLPFAEELE